MDQHQFDGLTRLCGSLPSRRRLLRQVGGVVLGLVIGATGFRPTAAACLANRKPCRRGGQCCSGLCRGQRGKKTCRPARFQGVCTVEQNVCVAEEGTACGSNCSCYVTRDGRSFCGRNAVTCGCGANNDCAQIPGAVCVQQGLGCCAFAGNTTCVLPCQDPD